MRKTADEGHRVVKAAEVPLLDFVAERLKLVKTIREEIERNETLIMRRVVQADKILEMIVNGVSIEYDNVVVEGDLDLRKLVQPNKRVPTEHIDRSLSELNSFNLSNTLICVKSPVKITRSIIHGSVNFDNTILYEPINFEYSNFSENASFKGSQFNKDARFGESSFSKDAKFIAAIFRGVLLFWNTQFGGNAHFNSAQFSSREVFNFDKARFNKVASFREAIFANDVRFDDVIFGENAAFINTKFGGDAQFSGVQVCKDAFFENAQFGKKVEFMNVYFYGDAIFLEAQFDGDARFWKTEFFKDCNFVRAKFDKSAYFKEAEFHKIARFEYAEFDRDAIFHRAKFGTDFHEGIFADIIGLNRNNQHSRNKSLNIDFRYSKFNGLVDFAHSIFYLDTNFYSVWFGKEVTKFQDARFKGSASFKAATFPRFANFVETWFRGNADFAEAKFTGDSRFDNAHFDKNLILTGTRIDTMALNNCQFKIKSEILLKEAIFNRLYIKWDLLKMHLKYQYEDGYDWATYSALVKNFRDLVKSDDADDCYYDFRKRHQNTKNWFTEKPNRMSRFNWSKLYDWIGLKSCGYGTKLWRALIWVLIFATLTLGLYNKYGSDNSWTICSGFILSGIALPLFIVVLARKLIR